MILLNLQLTTDLDFYDKDIYVHIYIIIYKPHLVYICMNVYIAEALNADYTSGAADKKLLVNIIVVL